MTGVTFNPNNSGGSVVNPNDPNATTAAPPDLLSKTSAALSETSTLAKARSLKDSSNDVSANLQNLRNSNNPIGNAPAPPAPGGIAASSVGSWMSGSYLTALFMSITEFASIMKEVAFLGNKLKLAEQSLVLQLGQSSAAQIIEAGKKEAGMYIASAISSLAEGAVAIASVVAQKKGFDKAEKSGNQLKAQKETTAKESQKQTTAAESELKNSKVNTEKMKQNQNLAQNNLADARANADASRANNNRVKADANSTDQQKIDAKNAKLKAQRAEVDAEIKFDSAIQDTRDAKAREFKDQTNYDKKKAQSDRDRIDYEKFDVMEHTQNAAQQNALALTQSLNAFGKFMDSSMNFLKAALVAEKSQAEAQSKILDTYMQIALKGVDNAAEQEKAAHDMIASLFQALQRYSDDMNKLVNTITAQRGA